jgi:GNAT superfamily N-acetyltransferase
VQTLDEVVAVADAGLHRWVHEHASQDSRREALREELTWAVEVATVDRAFAEGFASAQPQSGQPAEAYLNRWVQVGDDLAVLAGPRYRGRDPERPFVAVDAATRVLDEADLPALRAALQPAFAGFRPRNVVFWSSRPPHAWPGCGADKRDVVGVLAELAARPRPVELSFEVAADLAFYPRYEQVHHEHVAAEPEHALHTRLETREELADLVEQGLVFDVTVDGRWAGVVAAWRAALRGLRGFEVVELLLDPAVRGRGYGRHLSSALAAELLARTGTTAADRFLVGTIHADNRRAYRAALAAGRHDVGGEVVVPLTP